MGKTIDRNHCIARWDTPIVSVYGFSHMSHQIFPTGFIMQQRLLSRWGIEPVIVAEDPETIAGTSTGDPLDDELTGRYLWDCAKVLYDLVADPDPYNTFSIRGKRVLELGAGTGALSVGLSRAGAASVTCTDLPCHIPRIKATVEANTRDTGGSRVVMARSGANEGAIHVAPLRWGDDTQALAMSGWPPAQAFPLSDGDDQAADTHLGSHSIVGTSVGTSTRRQKPVFDVIVMSEILYWPGLDLLVEDTREPLRSTIVELSHPGTSVFLVYKERWPDREKGFLMSCEEHFKISQIPVISLELPATTREHPDSKAIKAVLLQRLPHADTALS